MFTTSAMTFTAQCADGPRDGPSLAQSARELAGDSSHAATRVATYHYFTPSLIYYLGHPVTRLSTPEQVALFFEQGGEALILSRKTYDKQRQLLPNDLIVRAEVSRFLRPDERVVLVSRPIEFAKGAVHEQSR